jgi:hypothetical protein
MAEFSAIAHKKKNITADYQELILLKRRNLQLLLPCNLRKTDIVSDIIGAYYA